MSTTVDLAATESPTRQLGLSTDPVPVSGFTNPEYHDQEMERIWKRTWLIVGRVAQIPSPGDYFVKALPFAKTSVLVVRNRDGSVRAFHNVCSHRCNKLAWADEGNSRTFRCGYHGWVFGLDGDLLTVPDSANFFDLDKATLGLTPVAVEVWQGFVFVNLAPQPPESLQEFLGDLHTGLSGYPFESFTHDYAYTSEVKANHKVVRDAFLEGYHVFTVHKNTAGKASVAKDNPFLHNLSYTASKYHASFSVPGNPEYQPSAMDMLALQLGDGTGNLMLPPGNLDLPRQINPLRKQNWAFDVFWIFPNTVILPFGGFVMWHSFIPISVDRCIWDFHLFGPPPANATQRWLHELNNTISHTTALEDFAQIEATHEVIGSGAKKHIQLQEHEVVVRLAHHWTQQLAGAYPQDGTR